VQELSLHGGIAAQEALGGLRFSKEASKGVHSSAHGRDRLPAVAVDPAAVVERTRDSVGEEVV